MDELDTLLSNLSPEQLQKLREVLLGGKKRGKTERTTRQTRSRLVEVYSPALARRIDELWGASVQALVTAINSYNGALQALLAAEERECGLRPLGAEPELPVIRVYHPRPGIAPRRRQRIRGKEGGD